MKPNRMCWTVLVVALGLTRLPSGWAAQDVGDLLRSLGFLEVQPLWRGRGVLGTNHISVGLGFGNYGSLWKDNPTNLSLGYATAQPLQVGGILLADLSPALTGPEQLGGRDIILGAAVLQRYSALYLPAVDRLFFRETPLDAKRAEALDGLWQRSGLEKHPLVRVGEDMMIRGELNSRPAGFFVRPQLQPTFLDLNVAGELGFTPKDFPHPKPRRHLKIQPQPFEEETHQGLDVWRRYVDVERIAFGSSFVRPTRIMVSDRVFPGCLEDVEGVKIVGLIGDDVLTMGGAVVDFRSNSVYMLTGDLWLTGKSQKRSK